MGDKGEGIEGYYDSLVHDVVEEAKRGQFKGFAYGSRDAVTGDPVQHNIFSQERLQLSERLPADATPRVILKIVLSSRRDFFSAKIDVLLDRLHTRNPEVFEQVRKLLFEPPDEVLPEESGEIPPEAMVADELIELVSPGPESTNTVSYLRSLIFTSALLTILCDSPDLAEIFKQKITDPRLHGQPGMVVKTLAYEIHRAVRAQAEDLPSSPSPEEQFAEKIIGLIPPELAEIISLIQHFVTSGHRNKGPRSSPNLGNYKFSKESNLSWNLDVADSSRLDAIYDEKEKTEAMADFFMRLFRTLRIASLLKSGSAQKSRSPYTINHSATQSALIAVRNMAINKLVGSWIHSGGDLCSPQTLEFARSCGVSDVLIQKNGGGEPVTMKVTVHDMVRSIPGATMTIPWNPQGHRWQSVKAYMPYLHYLLYRWTADAREILGASSPDDSATQ